MVPSPNITMQSINESAPVCPTKHNSKLGSLKQSFGIFKKGKHKDIKSTESVSSDGSGGRRMFHYRSSSLSDADEDDDSLLVDKYGFIINVETFEKSVSVCSADDPDEGSFKDSFTSLSPEIGTSESRRKWASSLGLSKLMTKKKGTYESLVAKTQNNGEDAELMDENKVVWDAIERDLRRTFPKHSLFHEQEDSKAEELQDKEAKGANSDGADRKEPYGKQALRRLLRAYSIYDAEVGYCQGMNFIAGMLLTFMSEEESFWVMVVIMNEEPFKLREIFGKNMTGTHEILYIADKLVHVFLPELYEHLEKNTVHTSMFSTQWLMTIYTSTFPFDLVSGVWDTFLSEGWKIVYKTLIALLMHAKEDGKLLDKNMEEILSYLRHFQAKVDGEKIIKNAQKVPLKQRQIQKYASEFRNLTESGEMQVHEVIQRFLTHDEDSSTIVSSNSHSSSSKVLRFIRLKRQKNVTVQDFSPKLVPVAFEAKLVVMISDILSPEECEELLRRGKETGYEDVLIRHDGMKASDHIAKCNRATMRDFDLADELFQRVMGALEGIPELLEKFEEAPWMKKKSKTAVRATSVNDALHFLKFGVGDSFKPLRDSTVKRGIEASCCSMHVYLNDDFSGGMTSFRGERDNKHFDIKPKAGSIVIFDQDLRHEECEVTKGRRHFIRTDIMYSPVHVDEVVHVSEDGA